MVKDSAIKNQNILFDSVYELINITFSMPLTLNTLTSYKTTKRNTTFTANDSHIKITEDYITEKYYQTALDQLKSQILTEVTQKIKKLSKCNTSSTPEHLILYVLQNLIYKHLRVKLFS